MMRNLALTAAVLVGLSQLADALPRQPAVNATASTTNDTVTASSGKWSASDEPQSCVDKAKELCGHCHISKKCWTSCATDHESELEAAGCTAPSADRLATIGSGKWSPSDEPQSCIDKAEALCGADCGLTKKNACWVRCATKHRKELKAAGCIAPGGKQQLLEPTVNATTKLGSAPSARFDNYYTISNGNPPPGVLGTYYRVDGATPSANPSCGLAPIYKNGDFYLLRPDSTAFWVVVQGDESMEQCKQGLNAALISTGNCDGPPNTCASGKWKVKINGRTADGHWKCSGSDWCIDSRVSVY